MIIQVFFFSIQIEKNKNKISTQISHFSSSNEIELSFDSTLNENEYLNKTFNIHFVFVGDVSCSMKGTCDDNKFRKSSKIFELLENTTKKLSLKNKTNVQAQGFFLEQKEQKELQI